MTDKIREYMKLKNAPVSGSFDEERKLMNRMIELMENTPQLESRFIVRYIKDDGKCKECVYETSWAAESEVAFVIHELQQKYGCRVFATIEQIYEVGDA